ncbi:MAG: heparan-alpha-glucosaminide N-acetyltransferase domain-containing protein [Promethearchaeota archaeon]
MKVQRLKSIDIFRGLCMSWMVLTHLIDWWLKSEYNWLHSVTIAILDPIGASGFLFISGVSISISYRKRIIKVKSSEDYNYRMVRNSYLFRAAFILIIALIYNSTIAIRLINPTMIWTWFVLQTAAISLLITWPLLRTSKLFRIIVGVLVIILNQVVIFFLLPYEGDFNLYGVLFHILYNSINQDPILIFFPFFLFGTVIGDMIFDSFYEKDENFKRKIFKKNLFIPSFVIGVILIIFGILIKFPNYLIRESFSWIIYALGIEIILLSILLFFERFEVIKTKKSYKFLFYYSYYSLTIYLAHNILYLLFYNQLNVFNIWIFAAAAFIIIGIILRAVYNIWESTASIKVQVGKLSSSLTEKIEQRIKRNLKIANLNERKN